MPHAFETLLSAEWRRSPAMTERQKARQTSERRTEGKSMPSGRVTLFFTSNSPRPAGIDLYFVHQPARLREKSATYYG